MAATPQWKVYRGDEYVAACKYVEDAAALVAIFGEGSSIRSGHPRSSIVWAEGTETFSAGESYDQVEQTVRTRARQRAMAYRAQHGVTA